MFKLSSVNKKVILSGLVGLALFIVFAAFFIRPSSSGWTEPGDTFPGGLALGFVFLLATACSTFVSGALSVYLTFGEISFSREAINNSFYAGCITAIPLIVLCFISAFSAASVFPGCLAGTFGAVLLSVIGGCIAYETLLRLKPRKIKS